MREVYSVAPREEFGRLQRSPILRPIDNQPVWSIVCFFIDCRHRGQDVATALLRAAVRYAAERGAKIVEAYPVDTGTGRTRDAYAYVGTKARYEKAGFREVARRSETRPIMRYVAS